MRLLRSQQLVKHPPSTLSAAAAVVTELLLCQQDAELVSKRHMYHVSHGYLQRALRNMQSKPSARRQRLLQIFCRTVVVSVMHRADTRVLEAHECYVTLLKIKEAAGSWVGNEL